MLGADNSISIVGNHIYIDVATTLTAQSSKNFVYAFDTQTGKELWRTEFESYEQPSTTGMPTAYGSLTAPVADNNTIYMASDLGKAYAINGNTGSLRWTYTINLPGIFYAAKNGKAQQICPTWSNAYQPMQLTLQNGILYGGMKDHIYAVDATKGTSVWSHMLPATQLISEPIVVNKQLAYVVVCTSVDKNTCYINAYTTNQGNESWHTSKSYYQLGELTMQSDKIYAASASSMHIYVSGTGFYAWDGSELWQYSLTPESNITKSNVMNDIIIEAIIVHA